MVLSESEVQGKKKATPGHGTPKNCETIMRLKPFVFLFLVVLSISVTETRSAPNIVFIMADDMGYGDVHALNPESRIPTPNLDGLAAAGMTFTDAHTPSAVCTPTRYGVVTGRYCWRSRLKSGVLNGYSDPLIEADRPTVASFLSEHGYTCGMVGKWHLGLGWVRIGQGDNEQIDFSQNIKHGPGTLGFKESFVIPASLDFPPYVYIHNHKITAAPDREQPGQKFPAFLRRGPIGADFLMEDCLDHLLDKATRFVRDQAQTDNPFFLYFPLTAPHKPVLPHQRFRDSTQLGPYGDFIAQVDWTVGQLLDALDDAGVADNTLVIFTSDNGSYMFRQQDTTKPDHVVDAQVQAFQPDNHRANFHFRGTKADVWEAGHRVPFFARWPGHIEKGSHCGETICLTDFFATAAGLIGQDLPADAAEDSYSFLPLLRGERQPTPRPRVINHSAGGMFAIREGKWKLVAGNGSGGRQQPRGKPFQRPFQLFDLSQDISEQNNVLEQNREVAERLETALTKIRNSP